MIPTVWSAAARLVVCHCVPVLLLLSSANWGCAQNAIHSWTNTAGKTIRAEFIRLERNKLVIRKGDQQFSVTLSQLSAQSQDQALALAKSQHSRHSSPTANEMSTLWDHLLPSYSNSTENRLTAARTLIQFAKEPQLATEFLAGKVKPVAMTQKELLTVLSALGSADEAEWRPAYERLLACDPRLFMDVEKIFKLPQLSDYPARNRFADFLFALPAEDVGFNVSLTNGRNEELTIVTHEDGLRLTFKVHVGDGSGKTIEAYRGVSRDEGFTTETMRLMKSLLLLASFDTRESGEIIMTVASGHPKAMLTKLAQALINERKNPSARESLSNLWDDLPVGGNFELLKIPPTQTILQSLVQSHVSPAYAMIRLTKEPDAATQFIGEKLHPAEMSPEQFELLLEQLASDDETRWRDAFNKLHIFNRVWELEEIESLLAREQFQSYPARHRLVDLITLTPLTSSQSALRRRYKVVTVVEADGEDKPRFVVQCGPDDRFRGSSSIYWTEENERTAMSLLLLDSFKTSRAKEILQLMASGHPKASITQFARSILDSNQPDLTR